MEAFATCDRRLTSAAVRTVFTVSAAKPAAEATASPPRALPTTSADFLMSAILFCDSRAALSSGPVNPPILATRSSVRVPSVFAMLLLRTIKNPPERVL
ncbi:hypothetical protein D9M70_414450 [compost metagenome]